MLRSILRTYRPRQWVKSGFILAPALFTLHLLEVNVWLKLLLATAGFSLVASSIYVFNDLMNRSEDVLHPTKKARPIASGKLTTKPALAGLIAAFLVGMIMVFAASKLGAVITTVYFLTMILYSVWLRKLMVVDILIVAFGFVLRVILGAVVVEEFLSHWMLLCTFTIALYLGLVKRRQELEAITVSSSSSRGVLQNYPPLPVIDSWITVLNAMTLIFYALYTVDPRTVAKHNTDALIYTLPLVLYGVFRYQKLALNERAGEDPAALVVKDNGIRIVVLLWAVTVTVILFIAKFR